MSQNTEQSSHLTKSQLQNLASIYKRERLVLTVLLVLVMTFVVLDFFDDSADGADWITIGIDVVFGGLIISTIIYLWKNTPLSTKRFNTMLNQKIDDKHRDSETWKTKSNQLITGLTIAIDEQLKRANCQATSF